MKTILLAILGLFLANCVWAQTRPTLELFNHEAFSKKTGYAKIYLDKLEAGTINLNPGTNLENDISCFILTAKSNVEVEFYQKNTSDDNYPGRHLKYRGTNSTLHIDKGELKQYGLDNCISCIRIYIDGKLYPGMVWKSY